MRKVAILVLNDYSNDSRVIKTASSLVKKYQVEVFAFNNGEQPKQEVNELGVSVNRSVQYTKTSTGLLKKFNQLFSYARYFIKSVWSLKSFDIAHCNDLETLPVGVVAKLFNRKLKVVYDSHEYQTETTWMMNPVKKTMARFLERNLLKAVDKMSVVGPKIAEEYNRLYGVTDVKVVLNTPHFCKVENNQYFRTHYGLSDETKIFLYQGGLTKGRGIDLMLQAFSRLEGKPYALVVMGYGPLEELIISYSEKHSNIYFHKAVAPDVLLGYTASADFGITYTEDLCLNNRYCLPNKLFEYIMAGLPVLCSNLPEMKQVVESNAIGISLGANSVDELCKAITEVAGKDREQLNENIGNARLKYNWEQQEAVIFEMYDSLI